MLVTTNWDTVVEDSLRKILERTMFGKLRALHIHGSIDKPDTVYLPTEMTKEAYRSREEEQQIGGLHGSIWRGLEGCHGGKLKLSSKSIKFGKVAIGGQPATRMLKIENAGTATLVAAVPTQGVPFPVSGGEFTVSPHGSTGVTIQFVPTAKGAAHGAIEITSSDPKHRTVKVTMSGTGK